VNQVGFSLHNYILYTILSRCMVNKTHTHTQTQNKNKYLLETNTLLISVVTNFRIDYWYLYVLEVSFWGIKI